MTDIQKAILWRYATKHFDTEKKLTDETFAQVLEVLRMAPSSYGLQAWKFYVVKNPTMRARVRENAWGQAQATDASHLIAMAHRTDVTESDVHEYIVDIAQTRGVSEESLNGFSEMMLGTLRSLSAEHRMQWAARQVYLAAGFALAALAETGIDSCPMEGFDVEKVSELLGATAEGYSVALLLPVGYRSEKDETAEWKKVRYPVERVVKWIE